MFYSIEFLLNIVFIYNTSYSTTNLNNQSFVVIDQYSVQIKRVTEEKIFVTSSIINKKNLDVCTLPLFIIHFVW